jgi:hypothetical protein
MKPAPRDWNGWTPRPPRRLRLEEIRIALAASERVRAASDEIRARAGLPPLPDSNTVTVWRQRLSERNGSKPSSLETAIAKVEAARAASPAPKTPRLDEALVALRRAQEEGEA